MRRGAAIACFLASVIIQLIDSAVAQLALPPVPGTIEGNADVNLSGSATYTVPIKVPPGTAGTAPKIAIVYDSQAPSGALGAGWSISGLSKITRGLKNRRTDTIVQGPNFDGNDALYLDGQRLIPVAAGSLPCGPGAGYIKESDDQTCVTITSVPATLPGPPGFTVHTKAGLTMQYGMTGDSRIMLHDDTLLLWACNRIQDSTGNYIDFKYTLDVVTSGTTPDYNVAKISYTGNQAANLQPYASINFTYDTVRPHSTFIAGHEIVSSSRLAAIETDTETGLVSHYALAYTDELTSLNRFILASIAESGSDGVPYQPTKFTYKTALQPPDNLWSQDTNKDGYGSINPGASLTVQDNVSTGYKFIPITLGTTTSIDAFYSAEFRGKVEQAALQNTGTKFAAWPSAALPNTAVFAVDGQDLSAVAVDLDGNGSPYLFVPLWVADSNTYPLHTLHFDNVAGHQTYQQWVDVTGTYAIPLGADQKTVPRILSGNIFNRAGNPKAVDVLWDADPSKATAARGALQNTGSGLTPSSGFAPPHPLDESAHLIDVDCDGKAELAYFGNGYMEVYRATANGWNKIDPASADGKYIPQISPNIPAAAIRVSPPSGQGCNALLVALDGANAIHAAYYTTAAQGWQQDAQHTPLPFSFVDAQGNDAHAIVTTNKLGTEVAANWLTKGGQIKFAETLTPSGFDPTFRGDRLAPPMPLGRDQANGVPFYAAFVGDLNSDIWPDVVYFSNSRFVPNDVRIFDPNSPATPWPSDVDFNPAVPFAKQNQMDSGVRLIDLHGSGRQDIIYASADSSGKILAAGAQKNTGFGFQAAPPPNLTPPNNIAFTQPNINLTNAIQFVDVDGDGYIDLVYGLSAGGTLDAKFGVYLNQPGGGDRTWEKTPDPNFKLPIPLGDKTAGDLGVRFVDLNGDGRVDIVYSRLVKDSSGTHIEAGAFLNNGSGWSAPPNNAYAPPVPFVVMPGVANNTASTSAETEVQLIDVNGDGLPDLVFYYVDPENTANRVKGVCLNTGSGWPANFADCTKIDVPVPLDFDPSHPNALIQYIDLNGDGLTDIVVTDTSGGGSTCTYIGTGVDPAGGTTAWAPCNYNNKQWTIPTKAISSQAGDPGFRMIDVNGDGLPDIIYSVNGGGVFLNTGSGWPQQPTSTQPGWAPPMSFSLSDGSDAGVRLLDVNGDGLPDFIQSFTDSSGNNQTGAWINESRRSDVLSGIADGLGVTTTICYNTILELRAPGSGCNTPYPTGTRLAGAPQPTGVYAPNETLTYPLIRGVPTSYVVQTMSIDDGHSGGGGPAPLTFSYNYGGLKFDALSRHSLGFAWRTALDTTKQITTQLNLAQSDANKNIWIMGLTVDTVSCTNANQGINPGRCVNDAGGTVANAKLLSDAHTDWATNARNVGTYQVATVTQTHNKTQKYDLDGSDFGWETIDFSYDTYANVTQLVTARSDTTRVTTINEYNDDANPNPTPLWLGRLAKSTVTKIGEDGKSSETRAACFTYDAQTGLLNLEIANFGDPKQVAVTYQRDAFGNIKDKKQMAGGTPSGKCAPSQSPTETRETARVFDAFGRFAVAETNPAQLTVTSEYSSAFGTPLSIRQPDSTVTRYAYDGFGRLAKRIDPAGLVTTIQFQWLDTQDLTRRFGPNALSASAITRKFADPQCNQAAPSVDGPQFVMAASSGQLPAVYTIFDRRGREIRKLSIGFGGSPVLKNTQYDIYGRVESASRPYFAKDAPPTVQQCYDVLDRVLEVDEPSGETIQRTYQGRTTLIAHKFSNTHSIVHSSITTNARNNPSKVVDAKGGTTTFHYDPGDRIVTITGPAVHGSSAVTTYHYDSVGLRNRATDPDMGTWTYEYDAFGQLRRQKDAKGQVITIDYDVLGRPLHRVVMDSAGKSDRSDRWEYDKGTYGQGHISSIRSSNGYLETYFYDSFGRNNGKAITIGKEGFYGVNEFDIYGRITAVGYPNGFVADYSYDKDGFLVGIDDRLRGKLLWKADAIDELGRVTAEHLGNGAATTRVYAHNSGYLSSIKTTSHATTIQSLSLDYDLAGDLMSRKDGITGSSDTFDYDDLEQLAGVTSIGQTFHYDAAGRMTVKGRAHDFTYGHCDQPHPFHAPCSYTDAGGRHLTYAYDKNGNRLQGPTARIAYTPENNPQQVLIDNLHWSTFDYGPTGARFRQTEKLGFSIIETFYAGLFERSVDVLPGSGPNRIEHDLNYLVNQSGVFAVVELDRYVTLAVPNVVPNAARKPAGTPKLTDDASLLFQKRTFYLHKDQLGSITGLSDENGVVIATFSYDPWGVQKATNDDPSNTDPVSHSWSRGFTGHEEIGYVENVDSTIPPAARLVHMNGRVYDPDIGLFVSPDLVTQSLTDNRTFNRYSYVLNNPLKYVDPTGNFHCCGGIIHSIGSALGSAVNAVGHALGNAANAAGAWLQQNWREVVVVGVAVGVTILTAGTASPILAGMISGATAFGTSSALYGGSLGDVLKATATGALFGTLGAGISEAIAGGTWESIFAQGGLRGIETVESGGNFVKGFGIGALSALEPDIQDIAGFSGAALTQIGAQAALNGTISAIEGDKFGNGALWGAYTQIEMDSNAYQWSQGIQSSTLAGLVNATQTMVRDATGLIMAMNALPATIKGVVAAATFATVSTFDASIGPYDFQTSMMIAGSVQQMRTDPFLAGTLMFSSSTAIGLSSQWRDYQDITANYLATYAYGFAAQGPLGSSTFWQSQIKNGVWSP
jgi:RHS repeat-associated protein